MSSSCGEGGGAAAVAFEEPLLEASLSCGVIGMALGLQRV